MERKIKFAKGEFYHVFSRGVEKRKIFLNAKDYERFLSLLYILNQNKPFHTKTFLQRKKNLFENIFEEKRKDTITPILCYSLLPNHFHLLLFEKNEGGISKFVGKLLTGYSMYFNKKYERSGPLFIHPFRSVHVSDDSQFRYLFNYIHLNPIDLMKKNMKLEIKNAKQFIDNYKYSSFCDFSKANHYRPQEVIIDKTLVPEDIPLPTSEIDWFKKWVTMISEINESNLLPESYYPRATLG